MKEILKGSALIFSFKIMGALSLFGVHLLIARYYGASSLGVFNLVQALLVSFTIVSRLGMDMYVVRMIPELETDREKVAGFIQKVFKLITASSVVSIVILLLFLKPIDAYLFKSFDASNILFTMALIVWPYTFFNVVPEMFRGFQDIKIYSFFRNVSQNFCMIAVLSAGMFVFSKNIDPVYLLFWVSLILTIVMIIVLFFFLKGRNVNLFIRQEYAPAIVKYSYPMLLTSSMLFVMGNIDSFMISYYIDEKQVGFYAACLKISLFITFILTSVNNYILPKISKLYHTGQVSELIKLYTMSVKLILISTLPIIVVILLFPSWFLGIFGDEFKSYENVLYVMMMMNIVSVFIGPVINILSMMDMQNYVKNIMLIGLLVNIVANYILIPRFGILGAAAGTLLSTLVWKLLAYIKLKSSLEMLKGFTND